MKRKIVLKAFGNYRKARNDIAAYWKDEVLGDPAFYAASLQPVLEKLDALGQKTDAALSAADVATLFTEAVPDWMEFSYKVAELRQDYLRRKLTDGNP